MAFLPGSVENTGIFHLSDSAGHLTAMSKLIPHGTNTNTTNYIYICSYFELQYMYLLLKVINLMSFIAQLLIIWLVYITYIWYVMYDSFAILMDMTRSLNEFTIYLFLRRCTYLPYLIYDA